MIILADLAAAALEVAEAGAAKPQYRPLARARPRRFYHFAPANDLAFDKMLKIVWRAAYRLESLVQ